MYLREKGWMWGSVVNFQSQKSASRKYVWETLS